LLLTIPSTPLISLARPLGYFPNGLGNVSLSVLYGTCALSVFFAPPVLGWLGTRATMVFAAACYVAYMLSLIEIVPAVVLAFSTVIGFGDILLWTAVGVFIAQNSTRAEFGANSGLFWSLFQLCNIVGNLAVYFAISTIPASAPLYVGFSVVAATGTGMLLLLRKPDATEVEEAGEGGEAAEASGGIFRISGVGGGKARGDGGSLLQGGAGSGSAGSGSGGAGGGGGGRRDSEALSSACFSLQRSWAEWWAATEPLRDSIVSTSALLCARESLLLTPMYLFSGLELSFWSGEFSQMLPGPLIGLVLTFAGVGEVAGGVLFGRLSDSFGRSASIAVGAACYSGGLLLACYMRASGWMPAPLVAGAPLVAYVAALLFGLGDAAFNANCYALVAQIYQRNEGEGEGEAAGAGDGAGNTGAEALLAFDERREDAGVRVEGGGGGGGAPSSVLNTGLASVGAYTVFQMLQNLGSGVGFFLPIAYPMHDPAPGAPAVPGLGFAAGATGSYALAYLQFAMLAVGLAGFVVVDREHAAKVAAAGAARAAAGARATKA
jgi:MFS family permease